MTVRHLLAAFSVLALAACSSQKQAPTPRPLPGPVATRPAPPQPLPPAGPLAWMDQPATPGEWSYRTVAAGSQALFGPGGSAALVVLACNRAARQVELTVPTFRPAAPNPRPAAMRVLTQFTNRPVESRANGGQLVAVLAANDPLLDSMAFSRGRFAVEIAGEPTLYLPAWPEVARVVEDCR
jgi:hypothetical protein